MLLFSINTYVVVQFYPWFKFYFPLFQTHYHTLPYQKEREIKFKPRIKLNHNIYIDNCYLIKCNKPEEKYCVSRKNTWINNLNLYHFLQFTVGKPELIPT